MCIYPALVPRFPETIEMRVKLDFRMQMLRPYRVVSVQVCKWQRPERRQTFGSMQSKGAGVQNRLI